MDKIVQNCGKIVQKGRKINVFPPNGRVNPPYMFRSLRSLSPAGCIRTPYAWGGGTPIYVWGGYSSCVGGCCVLLLAWRGSVGEPLPRGCALACGGVFVSVCVPLPPLYPPIEGWPPIIAYNRLKIPP